MTVRAALKRTGAEAARGEFETGVEIPQARQQHDDDERQRQHRMRDRDAVPFADQAEFREQPVDRNRQHDMRHDDRRRNAVFDHAAAAKASSRQPEGERNADQKRQHRRRRADLEAAPGGVDPGRIIKVTRIPFEREARRRKAQITSRTERDRKQHDQRQHQKCKDQPADEAQHDPPCPDAALLSHRPFSTMRISP